MTDRANGTRRRADGSESGGIGPTFAKSWGRGAREGAIGASWARQTSRRAWNGSIFTSSALDASGHTTCSERSRRCACIARNGVRRTWSAIASGCTKGNRVEAAVFRGKVECTIVINRRRCGDGTRGTKAPLQLTREGIERVYGPVIGGEVDCIVGPHHRPTIGHDRLGGISP